MWLRKYNAQLPCERAVQRARHTADVRRTDRPELRATAVQWDPPGGELGRRSAYEAIKRIYRCQMTDWWDRISVRRRKACRLLTRGLATARSWVWCEQDIVRSIPFQTFSFSVCEMIGRSNNTPAAEELHGMPETPLRTISSADSRNRKLSQGARNLFLNRYVLHGQTLVLRLCAKYEGARVTSPADKWQIPLNFP